MPEYVKKSLDMLHDTKPKRPQYAPHCWSGRAYGKRLQMSPDPDESNIIDKNFTKITQSIVGTMLYYARSVDPTVLREINKIPRVQSRPTRDTEEKTRMLLDYAETYPNSILRYKASDMFLHVDSDTV